MEFREHVGYCWVCSMASWTTSDVVNDFIYRLLENLSAAVCSNTRGRNTRTQSMETQMAGENVERYCQSYYWFDCGWPSPEYSPGPSRFVIDPPVYNT